LRVRAVTTNLGLLLEGFSKCERSLSGAGAGSVDIVDALNEVQGLKHEANTLGPMRPSSV